nr:MAG TPA: hypothetical protein [Caudoviricetes sp.]
MQSQYYYPLLNTQWRNPLGNSFVENGIMLIIIDYITLR